MTQNQRLRVYEKTGGRCAYCGCRLEFEEMQVDHMISLHNHGKDSMENYLPSCADCNHFKAGSNPDGFRKRLKKAFRNEYKYEFLLWMETKYEGWDERFYFEKNADDKAKQIPD